MLLFSERVYDDILESTDDVSGPEFWAMLASASDLLIQVVVNQVTKIGTLTMFVDTSFDGKNWSEIYSKTSPSLPVDEQTIFFESAQLGDELRGPLVRLRLRFDVANQGARATVFVAGRARRTGYDAPVGQIEQAAEECSGCAASNAEPAASPAHRKARSTNARPGTASALADADLVQQWQDLSGAIQATRQLGIGSLANPILLQAAADEKKTPFAPLYAMWAIDSFMIDGMHEEALATARVFEKEFRDREFLGNRLLENVLMRSASCSRVLGDPEGAEKALRQVIRIQGEGSADAWFELGGLAESAGKGGTAIDAYSRAALAASKPRKNTGADDDLAELARRNAAWLSRRTDWVRPDPESLARELMSALRRKDHHALGRLASKTHFSIGQVGAHSHYDAPRHLLRSFAADLTSSKVRGNPESLEGCGRKRYLVTDGWDGKTWRGRVQLMMRQVTGGWEWNGIAADRPLPAARKLFDEAVGPWVALPNQDLAISIKAPWPAPLGFQAGGLDAYSSWIALEIGGYAIATAATLAACIATGPFYAICVGVALPIALGVTYASHTASRIAAGSRPCGWGPAGFWYNSLSHNRTGSNESQFAIDFARYEQANAYPLNLSAGTRVLACHDGLIVERPVDMNSTGSDVANKVLQSCVPAFTTAPARYHAKYLHLDGPNKVIVSFMQWVQQGYVLGFMDDTGNSVHSHLHFQMHDRTITSDHGEPLGRTTRPTPMDGQRLDDLNDGACIISSNRVANPKQFCRWVSARLGVTSGPGVLVAAVCASLPPDPLDPIPATSVVSTARYRADSIADPAAAAVVRAAVEEPAPHLPPGPAPWEG
ncbi:MAG: peptidoglycan DD-metalloendopeptidase family protein [Myxococcota bacterium]|nr:peptidoglycan DD-metalloendopeptidase family protein [Myxococcota bacterium]